MRPYQIPLYYAFLAAQAQIRVRGYVENPFDHKLFIADAEKILKPSAGYNGRVDMDYLAVELDKMQAHYVDDDAWAKRHNVNIASRRMYGEILQAVRASLEEQCTYLREQGAANAHPKWAAEGHDITSSLGEGRDTAVVSNARADTEVVRSTKAVAAAMVLNDHTGADAVEV